jgi:hypothetical protein
MHATRSVGSVPFFRRNTRRERLPPAIGREAEWSASHMPTSTIETPELPDVTSTAYPFGLAICSADWRGCTMCASRPLRSFSCW